MKISFQHKPYQKDEQIDSSKPVLFRLGLISAEAILDPQFLIPRLLTALLSK